MRWMWMGGVVLYGCQMGVDVFRWRGHWRSLVVVVDVGGRVKRAWVFWVFGGESFPKDVKAR